MKPLNSGQLPAPVRSNSEVRPAGVWNVEEFAFLKWPSVCPRLPCNPDTLLRRHPCWGWGALSLSLGEGGFGHDDSYRVENLAFFPLNEIFPPEQLQKRKRWFLLGSNSPSLVSSQFLWCLLGCRINPGCPWGLRLGSRAEIRSLEMEEDCRMQRKGERVGLCVATARHLPSSLGKGIAEHLTGCRLLIYKNGSKT